MKTVTQIRSVFLTLTQAEETYSNRFCPKPLGLHFPINVDYISLFTGIELIIVSTLIVLRYETPYLLPKV